MYNQACNNMAFYVPDEISKTHIESHLFFISGVARSYSHQNQGLGFQQASAAQNLTPSPGEHAGV